MHSLLGSSMVLASMWDTLGSWFEQTWVALALVVGITGLVRLSLGFLARKLASLVARGEARESPEDGERRQATIVSIFTRSGAVVIYVVAGMTLLELFGVPIGPLLGGAAVFGLAFAFGAQTLIKDFFHGLVILVENQYTLGDIVSVGGVTGTVESMTLRRTTLRALDGTLHFIPHGAIESLANQTHGFSRAVICVGVGYDVDLAAALKTFGEVLDAVKADPAFAESITEAPKIHGVTALGESEITLRALVTTAPGRQWAVERAVLRRLLERFAEAGITLPYPQRDVHVHYPDGGKP